MKNKPIAMKTKVLYSVIILYLIPIMSAVAQESDLSIAEEDGLVYIMEEEKLARDICLYMAGKWGSRVFSNVGTSEQMHLDWAKGMVEGKGILFPSSVENDQSGVFSNPKLQELYIELMKTGGESLTDALQVGARIEEITINQLEEEMKETEDDAIINLYKLLRRGAESHLRAFVRSLKANNIEYKPTILSKERFIEVVTKKSKSKGRNL